MMMPRALNSLKIRYEIGSRQWRQSRLRNRHLANLPTLNPFDRAILADLERDGAAVTSLDALATNGDCKAFDLWAARDMLLALGKEVGTSKDYLREASPAQLAMRPQLIAWGLEERFLDIAESYIGLPVAYRGAVFRRDFADGQKRETRQWHRDSEDVRIMKIVVYIEDVDETGGAYCYLPKRYAPEKGIEFVDGRVPDKVMDRLVAKEHYVKCIGPAGTVVFTDPVTVWHHGDVPKNADRLSAFYAYNSHHPLRPQYCQPLFAADNLSGAELNTRQRAAINYSYPVTETS
tara:strand:+ start:361 stop:1233 length:873 start_codon:yes stop_codon:yes gene_type:complete